MRRILTTLLLVVAIAVSAEEHMMFMGVPIDGDLNAFCRTLEKKDMRQSKKTANTARYEGFFAGRPAYVIVETTPKTHTVCDVLVAFKELNNWDDMEGVYNDLKTNLIAEFGEPVETKEQGESPQYGFDIQTLLKDAEVIRRCRFETETGTIDLGIDNLRLFASSSGSPYTYLVYTDKTNIIKAGQEAGEDL